MVSLNGKYNTLKIFTETFDNETISQLINILQQEFTKGSQIRIMPDCHPGKGCVIGTTMTIRDKIVPYLVGSDIGCGCLTVKLKDEHIDFEKLDKTIRAYVPHGASIHQKAIRSLAMLGDLIMPINDIEKIEKGIGTLGSGNHFIEVDKNKDNELFLVIHTGSRLLGRTVCDYYQNKAVEICKKNNISTPADLAFVSKSDYLDSYLHDSDIAAYFAKINRETIAAVILDKMGLSEDSSFDTVHNYIDTKNYILRKGAVSAEKGQKLIIPITMADGALICIGKGNPDWNFSAPHGAGRLIPRSIAKECLSLDDYKKSMEGIYTTSVKQSTIDESPMVYRHVLDITRNITDTVSIVDTLKPVYNFKPSK